MNVRERWSSKTVFVLAAIGSAIGLGNLWRFPYVTYKNGGGAFLIAYFICLFIVGIPLLMLEIALGKKYQNAAPGSFKKIMPNVEWFGWFAVGVAFVLSTYYAGIMSWCANYFVFSFDLKWGADPNNFFYNTVLGTTSEAWQLGNLQIPLLIGLLISWIWIIACVWKGARTVGKVVWVTVLGPWILLLVFVIRGITLPGAGDGLNFYLNPVWKMLLKPSVWLAAISQIFFSLSVGFAVMIAYGSFLDEKTDVVKGAFIIGISDAMTAFVGGFAVFGALGHMAHAKSVAVEKVVSSGPGLTFVTYPEIINKLPAGNIFGVLFFLMLMLLAVDSAFSIVEAVTSALRDKWGWSHKRANFTVGGISFLIGLLFITGAGYWYLDIVDHFNSSFGMTLVGLGECIIIGWILKSKNMREYINKTATFKINTLWDICIKFIIPISVIFMIVMEIVARFKNPYGNFGLRSQEFVFGWLVMILIIVLAFVFQKLKTNQITE